jgi:dTDP-4-amino-4,6-dideoxygalactose transaminase
MRLPSSLPGEWEGLSNSLQRRFQKAEFYAKKLANGPWQLLEGWQTSGVCWRFSLLIDHPEALVEFSEAVRRDGFHVSNLHWPLNQLFEPSDSCPQADWFARRILNLWVDDTVNLDWIEACCASLWDWSHLVKLVKLSDLREQ